MLDTTARQVTLLEGCVGTGQLKPHEEGFITDLADVRDRKPLVTQTEKQLSWLKSLYDRFFAA